MNIRNVSLRKLWWPVLISTLVGGAEIAGIRYCVKTRFEMDEAIADRIHARGETTWQRYGFKITSASPNITRPDMTEYKILIDTKRLKYIEMKSALSVFDIRGWTKGSAERKSGEESEVLFRGWGIIFRLHYTDGRIEEVGPGSY